MVQEEGTEWDRKDTLDNVPVRTAQALEVASFHRTEKAWNFVNSATVAQHPVLLEIFGTCNLPGLCFQYWQLQMASFASG